MDYGEMNECGIFYPYEALKKKICSEYVKFSGHALSV